MRSIVGAHGAVFQAVTNPPGYEADITWMSATKYGTALPVLGQGPVFIAEYEDTFGPHPEGGTWQWIGAKCDSAVFGQDIKKFELEPCPEPDPDICFGLPGLYCEYLVTEVTDPPGFPECGLQVGRIICILCTDLDECPLEGEVRVRVQGTSDECNATIVQKTLICQDCPGFNRFRVKQP